LAAYADFQHLAFNNVKDSSHRRPITAIGSASGSSFEGDFKLGYATGYDIEFNFSRVVEIHRCLSGGRTTEKEGTR
jgi:hypothetical protein